MVFFISAFIALVCAAFLFANSENGRAMEASKKATEAIKAAEFANARVDELHKEIQSLDADYKSLMTTILQNDEHGEKLKQKMEWLEMKVNNQPKHQSATKVILTQEAPLKIGLIYRQAKPPKSIEIDPKLKAALIKKVKTQVKELSK